MFQVEMKAKGCGLILAALVLFMVSCNNNKISNNSTVISEDTAVVEVPDTTIYGVAGDFGMSVFTLITDAGDTLGVTRTDSFGKDGQIYGTLRVGNRYAMTTKEDNEALGIVINLTQLELFTTDYTIRNGHLVLHPGETKDTVHITMLNDTVFKYLTVENNKEQRILLPEDSTSVKHFN